MFRRNIIREYEAKYTLLKDQRDEAEVKLKTVEIDYKNMKVEFHLFFIRTPWISSKSLSETIFESRSYVLTVE